MHEALRLPLDELIDNCAEISIAKDVLKDIKLVEKGLKRKFPGLSAESAINLDSDASDADSDTVREMTVLLNSISYWE